jgi:hypothetical protein
MILSDLASPNEAGFAKAGNRFPLFGIMLWVHDPFGLNHPLVIAGLDLVSFVVAGLDPATHPFTKMMDARVEPARDEVGGHDLSRKHKVAVIPGRATRGPGIQTQAQHV